MDVIFESELDPLALGKGYSEQNEIRVIVSSRDLSPFFSLLRLLALSASPFGEKTAWLCAPLPALEREIMEEEQGWVWH